MYVVVIRTKDSSVSPVVIGTFQTRTDAQNWGDHFDYRLRTDQLWSVAQIALPSQYAPSTVVTGGSELFD